MNTRGIGLMRRTCKAYGSDFDLAYRRGRPREHCYRCQPEGTRMLGAIKLMNLRVEERFNESGNESCRSHDG
jgi:hypothetical protein